MEKPKLTENHARLEPLVGEWSGTDQLHKTEWTPEGEATARFSIRPVAEGFFYAADWIEQMDGKTLMAGHGVIGFDAKAKEYTFHWFDTSGSPPKEPGRGTWKGDSLAFLNEYESHSGRTTFTRGKDGLEFKVEMGKDDKWQTVLEGRYERKNAKRSKSPETESARH